ncbi:DNA recombination protein RecN [Corynebacterium atypicum]|uniref:DNA repair protein RecN n=1 Tax=Corynebacterium atypicum TaxID=191610 RepID=A0ABN4DCN9_9CORY|nr:DNA repair protein RecN [Corynebacterium atypicum]AIG64185.1 DNA recombination protein RecN [Corynebacterium atypicum]
MLVEMTIENLGVLPRARAEFSPGLTVLTGETGAGKTMVVTGLKLLSGARAEASRIRRGAKSAAVEGVFALPQPKSEDDASAFPGDPDAVSTAVRSATDVAREAGAEPDENGDWLAARTLTLASDNKAVRSRAHLGGRHVPAATLGQFTGAVLTIHGQHDQLRLTSPGEQLAALDGFGEGIGTLKQAYQKAYAEHQKLAADLAERSSKRRELAQEIDRLEFALGEIDQVAPVAGEDEELVARIRRLQDVDALREAAEQAVALIDGPEALGAAELQEAEPAAAAVGRAAGGLGAVDDDELRALGERLDAVTAELAEVSGELGAFLAGLDMDPEALEQALLRQQQLKGLTRKYAPDAAGVVAWREKVQRRLAQIDVSPAAVEELQARVGKAEQKRDAAAAKLSRARNRAAKRLSAAVTAELAGLAMGRAEFSVAVRPCPPGPKGADEVEFMLAPAPDAEPRGLAASASGGELSRVMLALEVIVAGESAGTTLVFDEVDSGVGGQAAIEIGRRLARLSLTHQVIVVTHLPQVAAFAQTHLHVEKEETSAGAQATGVVSEVTALAGESRVRELARMLAGLADSESGRAHAADLLARAQKEREAMARDA